MLCVYCKLILAFQMLINLIFHTKSESELFLYTPEIFKFQTGFCVQNHLLNLCSRVVNSQRFFCSQKAGVKCSYQRFLVNKNCCESFFPKHKCLKINEFNTFEVIIGIKPAPGDHEINSKKVSSISLG